MLVNALRSKSCPGLQQETLLCGTGQRRGGGVGQKK